MFMSWKMEKQLNLTAVVVTPGLQEGVTPSIRNAYNGGYNGGKYIQVCVQFFYP